MTERKDIGGRLENWAGLYQPSACCDLADAKLLDGAMTTLAEQPRTLLWLCYIDKEKPEAICQQLGIPLRPGALFVEAFHAAQSAIESELARRNSSAKALTSGIMNAYDCIPTP